MMIKAATIALNNPPIYDKVSSIFLNDLSYTSYKEDFLIKNFR